MNDADWRACVTPKKMLRFLIGTDAPRAQELAGGILQFANAYLAAAQSLNLGDAPHDRG
jgi:hypothetical protein